MATASIAAGADGLLIEVHDHPDQALSDGAQSLYPEQFDRPMGEFRIIAPVLGRTLPLPRMPAAGGSRT
jgi:3-deoxy-7-phosphoheptulonate synthase